MVETSGGKLCSPKVGKQAGRRRLWKGCRRSPMTGGRGGGEDGLAPVNDLGQESRRRPMIGGRSVVGAD